ncbi:hypothetical protein S40285_08928 [Stachybotrys chlorohalonatus IBT 40285]|uniref:Aminotransferase class I/classII large domain-containing protein n=1 Tax=Stachybotrys chlorohalonatus (strain IBT 40285) TaxID=1283841 RepID=A0A084QZU3_STAC4|nr:hypothetical protein S40285_08928 [Stachybotrys chlorohalonata IBT 40285]
MAPSPGPLEEALASRLASRESRSQLRRLTAFPHSNIDFSSNAYLSLHRVPEIHHAFLSAVESQIPSLSSGAKPPLQGSGGSRLLDGNSTDAESLERSIAAFHGAETGLLFNSGYDANVSFFSCVPQPGDVVVYDELVHASVHDGMRLSRAARRIAFKHNCMGGEDHATAETKGRAGLSSVLAALTQGEQGAAAREGRMSIFIAVEGVYSMDGDVAPLKEMVACVERHLPRGNGYMMVDEAHSTGLFGENGGGLVCELGLESHIFARLHTFGKALSALGAVMLCTPTTRQYLINYARPLIYTTALPSSSLASIRVAYDYLQSGRAEPLLRHLKALIRYTHSRLSAICSRHTALLRLHAGGGGGMPQSPIIPLLTPHPRSLARHCQERGITIRPVVAPTVPKGSERVRICLHAENSEGDVDVLCRAIEEWVASQQQGAPRGASRM